LKNIQKSSKNKKIHSQKSSRPLEGKILETKQLHKEEIAMLEFKIHELTQDLTLKKENLSTTKNSFL